jgi:hypothetical protein
MISMRVPLQAFISCALAASAMAADPAVTVYNQGFGVIREAISLDLKAGVNQVKFSGITARVEPDSVILRDPSGKVAIQVMEQNYHSDPMSLEAMMAAYEGKTIEFQLPDGKIVSGRIVRAGFGGPGVANTSAQWFNTPNVVPTVARMPANPVGQPMIESEGKLRFGLPGAPMFPPLAADAMIKPTLEWMIQSDRAAKVAAELGYVSGGLNWKADYNIVSPDEGDKVEMIGWVTIENETGIGLANARIALMAGDVNKQQPRNGIMGGVGGGAMFGSAGAPGGPQVTEKTFDDYHLYTLQNRTSLADHEHKQVEFLRAPDVVTKRVYVYDGAKIDPRRYPGWNYDSIRNSTEYGTESNPKVWVMREFANTESNRLGMPLPKGNVRFYRRDGNGQLEFTGENEIDHTPHGETIRVYTGSAFDVVGERRRTDYQVNHQARTADETFEIKVRNRKKETVEVRVVEHLYRGVSWTIPIETDQHVKMDSQMMEYRVTVKPEEEKVLKYSAHYTW